jgi:hypothetical protein
MSPDRCRWCATPIPSKAGPGRPPEFCSRRCRRRWHLLKEQRDVRAEQVSRRVAEEEARKREEEAQA